MPSTLYDREGNALRRTARVFDIIALLAVAAIVLLVLFVAVDPPALLLPLVIVAFVAATISRIMCRSRVDREVRSEAAARAATY